MKPSQIRPGDNPSAVLYLRVASVDPQNQHLGISEQREACVREAKLLGAVITDEFMDIGENSR